MKKLCALFVAIVLMLMAVSALAAEAKPGDQVNVTFSIKENPSILGGVSVSYDSSMLEYVSHTDGVATYDPSDKFFVVSGGNVGTLGTVTFKVKDGATGTIRVSASGEGADFNANNYPLKVSVSGGSITIIAAECSHTWDNGSVTTPAACETSGVNTLTCTQCGETKEETIPATGHTVVDGETVQPTCTQDGYTTGVCSVCGKELEKQVLPALDHLSDGGKETKAPTCTEKGVKTHTCTRCGEVIKTEEIPALDHLPDGGKETKAPNCTEAGVKTYTCTVCGKVIKTEEIPALGHKPGDWVVVKEATKEGPGLKEKYCTVCDAVVDSQTINLYRYLNRKVSTAGIRFSDEGDLTDEWFMFTPVDLSADGEQTIDLVGANKHVIGKVYVTVADGQVTVKHEVYKHVEMKEAVIAFFPDLASVATLEQSQLTGYAFDEAISIEEQLGGDTKVLLYIDGMALYREDGPGLDLFNYAADAYQQHVEELKALMD